MYNVIKAQVYQLKHDIITWCIFAGLLAFFTVMTFVARSGATPGEITGSSVFTDLGDGNTVILNFITLIMTARICGWDLGDNTVNYELLTGTRRRDIHAGRFITSFVSSVLMYYIVISVYLLVNTAIDGWGTVISPEGTVFRLALMIFPIFRLTALYTLLTFLFRDGKASALTGYILTMLGTMFVSLAEELAFDEKIIEISNYCISLASAVKLLDLGNLTFDCIDGKDVMVIKDMMTPALDISYAAVCVAAGIVFLIISWTVFRRRDMK